MDRDTYGVNPLAPNPQPARRNPGPHAESAENRPVTYDGEAGNLFGIVFRNTLLGLLTLGIYRFWGKTRLRRYLWSHLRLFGDRLEYSGTAKELFLGFLIALAVLIPLGIVTRVSAIIGALYGPATQIAIQVISYALIAFLIGVGIFSARRYRLTRTAWRGIHFSQSGSPARYALLWLGCALLTIFTLGLAKPVGDIALQRFLVSNTWLGSLRFEFDGRARDLFWRWVPCLLLFPFTFGLSLAWYAALRVRYFAACTRFATLGFALPVTFRDLLRIFIPYYLALGLIGGAFGAWLWMSGAFAGDPQGPGADLFLLAFIVVLFLPALQVIMITHRMMRLIAGCLTVTGHIDPERIAQMSRTDPKTGEGLADILDIGGGLEVGL